MNLGYLPTCNIYIFDKTLGTFTTTNEQQTILDNDNIIIIDDEILTKKGVDTSVVADDYIQIGGYSYYFSNKTYKLTWTSTTYTLKLISGTDLTGFTWVANSTLKGIENIGGNITFTSNSTEYTSLSYNATNKTLSYIDSSGTATVVYNSGTWTATAYKTIKISGGTDISSDDLYSWLATNGSLSKS